MDDQKKPVMYRIYLAQDIVYGAGLIVPVVLTIIILYKIIDMIRWSYLDTDFLPPMIIMLLPLCIGTYVLFLPRAFGHYSRINKLKKTNPELVQEFEEAFPKAEDVGTEIFITDKFLFIADRVKFIVAQPGDITNMELYLYTTKHHSYFKIKIYGKDFKADPQLFECESFELDKERAIAATKRIEQFAHVEARYRLR